MRRSLLYRILFASLGALLAVDAYAQTTSSTSTPISPISSSPASSQTALSDGTHYANLLVPVIPGQVINPIAVNWKGSTNAPTTAPPGLGEFSFPNTNPNLLSTAQTSGLANMGILTQVTCQNYVAGGKGTTPATDQQCAAVNFLNNQCTTPSPTEAGVLNSSGTAYSQGNNCGGTFGGGQSQFNMKVSSLDPIFGSVTATAINNESAINGSTCTPVTVITAPAEYSENACVINNSGTQYTCSQSLSTTITSQSNPAVQKSSCISGILLGNYCQQTSSAAAAVTYICAEGYSLVGASCTQTNSQVATPNYSCPSGQTLEGSTCSAISVAVVASYSCPKGYTVSGSGCMETLTESASVRSYSCPIGYSVNGTYCTQSLSQTATPSYICPVGYSLDHSTCSKAITVQAVGNPGCPNGSTLNGPNCTTPSNSITPAMSDSYTCPIGYTLSGSSCTQTITQAALIATYSCPPGYSVTGSSCTVELTQFATPNYSCPTGYVLNGAACLQTLTQSGTPNYLCSTGILYGSSCLTTSQASVASYSCTSGYALSGTLCTQTLTQPASIAGYTCLSDQTQSGATCTSTSKSTVDAMSNYSCASGALSGSICTTSGSYVATPAYYCSNGTLSGTSCISNATSCPGTLLLPNNLNPNYVLRLLCTAGGWNLEASGNGASGPWGNPAFVAFPSYDTTANNGWLYFSCNGSSCTATGIGGAGNIWSTSYTRPTNTTSATISSYSCPSGVILS